MMGPYAVGDRVRVGQEEYTVLRLLGHGKGGWSYLVSGTWRSRLKLPD